MSEAKNHHYTPQSYLRKFAYQKGGEYYVHVRYKGEKFFESNIRNICSENYFYTIPNASDKNRVEKFYAEEIDNVFPILHAIAKDEGLKKLDQETTKQIVRAALSLYFRTPKFLKQYNDHISVLLESLRNYSIGKTKIYYVDFIGMRIDIRNIDLAQLEDTVVNNNKVLFLEGHLKVLDSLVEYKALNGIGVNMIVDDSELITSDNPVIIRNYNTGESDNLFDPESIIYLPIDRKLMLTIIPNSFGSANENVLRVLSTRDFTLSINTDVEGNSEKWIIGSEDSIKNHLDEKAKRNEWTMENIQWLLESKKKADLMNELGEILSKNGDSMNAEVAAKVRELAKHELLKDDPQMKKALISLIRLGY